jgi:hypothetical protein
MKTKQRDHIQFDKNKQYEIYLNTAELSSTFFVVYID